eukprot:6849181-Alexandrium_andersonii.AAC.1
MAARVATGGYPTKEGTSVGTNGASPRGRGRHRLLGQQQERTGQPRGRLRERAGRSFTCLRTYAAI